ncbi:leukotriene A-4 hydrolase-like [Lineus longissimus]|uniref:leukotriene A-4 hydrolase-like n=1 Tax=Lineus longissimus TaxID=88925 RepID=UPI002B4CE8B1
MAVALSPEDPSSFSRPEIWSLSGLHLNLAIDFATKTLGGSADISIVKAQDAGDADNSVILDTRDLNISRVYEKESGQDLRYSVEEPYSSFGSKLEIQLPALVDRSTTITIDYKTSPSCTALQWLTPEQTAGKRQPYLFSQCQAIHARSLVPCQDSPAVKFPYTANITAPVELEVLMSALKDGTFELSEDGTQKIHKFNQPVPIPSYLIAIVAGALESRDIGPRTKVWSEKEFVDKAAYEFEETKTMLQTAEDLLGPYVWQRYDLLVLPPSFPYGGMENPCLTFVTPTLLAGDRSLADVVAHEISHSWTGNLVTNKNWEHFWLNEGHTVFVERKILGRLYGEEHRHFSAINKWKDLIDEVDRRGDDSPLTHLVPDLKGVDPDDAFSCVPYEKGSTLLFYLEQKVGGAETFEAFLRAYIEQFKYKALTTEDWKKFLFSFFQDKVEAGVFDDVDWEAWFHRPGMPPKRPNFDTSLADICTALCRRWSDADDNALDQFIQSDITRMSSKQVTEFLSLLLLEPALSLSKMVKLKEVYKLNERNNSEIKFRWLRLGLRAHYADAIAPAMQFVTEQGRMKFVRPLYRDLYAWDRSKEMAVRNFMLHRHEMHNISAEMVAKDLQVNE